jgi:hypothetical protein
VPIWASTLIVAAVALLLIAAAVLGWRARVRRDAGLAPSHAVPAGLGEPLAVARVLYVATTAHGEPLERLAIAGLAFRAQGSLAVHASGLVVALDGGADVWIEASAAVAARPATVAIDKAVEKDGLLNLTWRLGGTRVDSYFRVLEPERSGSLYDAIDSITHAESEV